MGLLSRLRSALRRQPTDKVEHLTQPQDTGEPWDLWLAAREGRALDVVHVGSDEEHDPQIQQRSTRINENYAVLVKDAVNYSFARPWPGTVGQILVTFGTLEDVIERTSLRGYEPPEHEPDLY